MVPALVFLPLELTLSGAADGQGVGEGVGLAVGDAVGAGVAVGTGVGTGLGVAVGTGVAVGAMVGVAVGAGVAVATGVGVGGMMRLGVGVAVGAGVAAGAGVAQFVTAIDTWAERPHASRNVIEVVPTETPLTSNHDVRWPFSNGMLVFRARSTLIVAMRVLDDVAETARSPSAYAST